MCLLSDLREDAIDDEVIVETTALLRYSEHVQTGNMWDATNL